ERQDHHLCDAQHPGGGVPRLALRGADSRARQDGGVFSDRVAISARAADQNDRCVRGLFSAHLWEPGSGRRTLATPVHFVTLLASIFTAGSSIFAVNALSAENGFSMPR